MKRLTINELSELRKDQILRYSRNLNFSIDENENLESFLDCSMTWKETREGHKYWLNVYNKSRHFNKFLSK